MLRAVISEEEVKKFSEDTGVAQEQLCHEDQGEHCITMPCLFLTGETLSWVRCARYSGYRPAVCNRYYCRVAVAYRGGVLSLNAALTQLRRAAEENDPRWFNWCGTAGESGLTLMALGPAIQEEAQRMAQQGDHTVDEATIELVSVLTTARYEIANPQTRLTLDMVLDCAERDTLNVEVLLAAIEADVSAFTPEELAVLHNGVRLGLAFVRSCMRKRPPAIGAGEHPHLTTSSEQK